MKAAVEPAPHAGAQGGMPLVLAACLISIAAVVAYHNSLGGPLVFDDIPAIRENPSIRHLAAIGDVLSPPAETGGTVNGRPVFNLSLAINYALGGVSATGYHVANLAVHVAAALLLFGIVRRTLLQEPLRRRFGGDSLLLGACVALVWAVHPLTTAAVTYVVQRSESLMGLFYLATLYGFIRSTESPAPGSWLALSGFACLLGIGTKESMVTAPLVVLCYDRLFVAGGWAGALRRRGWYYGALVATWAILAVFMAGTGGRGGTVGFGTGVKPLAYLSVQAWAVARYLALSFWPSSLVFDYGADFGMRLASVWPQAVVACLLASATLVGLVRGRAASFAGVWFFGILAPTSSIIPVASQWVAEHRMYLPLAAIVALAMLVAYRASGRFALVAATVIAVVLAVLTVRRNESYRTGLDLWADTVRKFPANSRAHYNLGLALAAAGRTPDALAEFEAVLASHPGDLDALNKAGALELRQGAFAEAASRFRTILSSEPDNIEAWNNLGIAAAQSGRFAEAVDCFERVVARRPDSFEAHCNLGNALLQEGRTDAAVPHFEQALRINPGNAAVRDLMERLRGK